MMIKQYSIVRIRQLNRQFGQDDLESGSINKRLPMVGDTATIVEVYTSPRMGYELECNGPDGFPEWLYTFAPEDADLEVIM